MHRIWQRALVLFSSIPITIAMNGFRIGIVGVTVDRWGPRMAEGVLHFFEGWIIFAASALLLAVEVTCWREFRAEVFSKSSGLPTTEAVRWSAHAEIGANRSQATLCLPCS